MTKEEAAKRLDALISRTGDAGPALIGVLIIDKMGVVSVSMDADNETDITMIGVNARRKYGPIVVERELTSVTPTLETIR